MANSILSETFVFSAIEAEKSGTQFPIDFDDVWKTLGYSRKADAISRLVETHTIDEDYTEKGLAGDSVKPQGGRPSRKIYISIDGFKSFCMMAQTSKGKEVRKYFIEIEKTYRENLQRQLLSTVPAPTPVVKPSKKLKALEAEIANLQKDNRELGKKNDEYREDIKILFDESELLKNNICNKTDFDLSIDDIIVCLNPLPRATYSTKVNWIVDIMFSDGIRGTDWILTSLGYRVNYRFLIELAIFYRGLVGISFDSLPDTIILEKSRIYKNTQNQVNTRYPNIFKGVD